MDLVERRKILGGHPNPNPNIDYIISFDAQIGTQVFGTPADIFLRYVPDRMILDAISFNTYIENLEKSSWNILEEMAVIILDDIRNELVTRWVQVIIKMCPIEHPHLQRHTIMLQDFQPNWDNDDLLTLLASM